MKISLVIPVFNEEKNLHELLRRCLETCRSINMPFEIILVDDGSHDASRSIIEEQSALHLEIAGVFLNRNYGQHAAIMAGFAQTQGEAVVTLDADLQNPPEEIPRLVEKILQGHDMVGTVRRNRQDNFFRKNASLLVNKMVRLATKTDMRDYGCMLRAYSRQVVQALLDCREATRFIPLLAGSFAGNPVEIEVEHAPRQAGDSKYNLFRLISLYLDLLTGMSTFPLRLTSLIGILLSLIGFSAGLTIFAGRLIYGAAWAVDGTFTLFSLAFILLGGLYIGIGIVGEYLARLYNTARGRPLYIVKKIIRNNPENKRARPKAKT